MKHLKTSKQFDLESINNILIDIKDDFVVDIQFIPYGKMNYQLRIKTPTEVEVEEDSGPWGNTNHITHKGSIEWKEIHPYLEEFTGRIIDMGLEFKSCQIFQKVDSKLWEAKYYNSIPDVFDIGLFSWIEIDFQQKPSPTIIQRFKDLF